MSANDVKKSKQLMTYVYSINCLTEQPIEKIIGMMFFLDSGNAKMANFTQAQVEAHIAETVALARKIIAMDPTGAKANMDWYCRFCEFRTICKTYVNR